MKKCHSVILIAVFSMLLSGTLPAKPSFTLSSPAFTDGGAIPVIHTAAAGGKEISPPLQWSGAPEGTASFALICEDIDAPLIGSITHWVLIDIPPEARELKEALPVAETLGDGSRQGKNFYRRPGYMGPNPPRGTHRYVFRIYALDCMLKPAKMPGKRDLLKAMEGHILGTAETVGTFTR